MAQPDFFTIKNWAKFQHYKDRNPPWIKLHVEILSSEDWVTLADASRLLAMVCMIVAAKNDGRVPNNPAYIKRVAYLDKTPDLSALVDCGFLINPLADASARKQVKAKARPEKEAEAEKDSVPIGTGADAPLKEKLFGSCLAWLMGKTKLKRQPAAAMVGKWIRDHGEPEVLRAFNVASRESPPDPIAYMTRVLKPKAGKPDAKQNASAHLQGLAHVFGAGTVGPGEPEPASEGRIIDGDCRVVGGDEARDGSGIRPGDVGPDRVRISVRDTVPGPSDGAENLPRGVETPAGRLAEPSNCAGESLVGVGQSDAVSCGHSERGEGGLRKAAISALAGESGDAEGAGSDRPEERNFGGEVRRVAQGPQDDLEIPSFLDRRHEIAAA